MMGARPDATNPPSNDWSDMRKVTTMQRGTRIAIVSLAILALTAGVVGAATYVASGDASRRADAPADLVQFSTVSTALLQSRGLRLTTARSEADQGALVRLSSEAGSLASETMRGSAVREVQFVHCEAPGAQPPVSQDCWVVSLDPSNYGSHGPFGAKPIQATYAVGVVDPSSGRVLIRMAGA